MSEERSFELPPIHGIQEIGPREQGRPALTPEPQPPVILSEPKDIFPTETAPHRHRGFIETGFAPEDMDKLVQSKKRHAQDLAWDLLALNLRSGEKPLIEWTEDELKEEYRRWEETSKKLEDRRQKGQKVNVDGVDVQKVVDGVRKVIVLAAPDKEALLTGEPTSAEKEFDEKKIKKIKTAEVKEAFEQFILKWQDKPTVPQLQEMLAQWSELVHNPEIAQHLEEDKFGQKAVKLVFGKLNHVRSQRMKDAHVFSGDTDTVRRDEEPRRVREKITTEESEEAKERRERAAYDTQSVEERQQREEARQRQTFGQNPEDTMRDRHTIPPDVWAGMSELEQIRALRDAESKRVAYTETRRNEEGDEYTVFTGLDEIGDQVAAHARGRRDEELSSTEANEQERRNQIELERRSKLARLEYFEQRLLVRDEEIIKIKDNDGKMVFTESERREFESARRVGRDIGEQLRSKLDTRKAEGERMWQQFGWTVEQKNKAATTLRSYGVNMTGEQEEILLRAILLQGNTGAEFLRDLQTLEVQRQDGRGLDQRASKEQVDNYLQHNNISGVKEIDTILFGAMTAERFEDQRFRERPDCMEAYAWQLGRSSPKKFGEHGENPLWERRVEALDEDGNLVSETGKEVRRLQTREVVNQGNYMKWYRDRMMYLHITSKDEVWNFHKDVKLLKDQYSSISLSDAFEARDTMFMSRDRSLSYDGLATITEIETFIAMTLRQYHLEYKKVQESEEDVQKTLLGIGKRNQMTKDLAKHNNWYYLVMLSEDFNGMHNLDGSLGSVFLDNLIAYSRISNIKGLEDALGKDSNLFDGKKLLAMRDKMAEKDDIKPQVFYDLEHDQSFRKAFGIPSGLEGDDLTRWLEGQGKLKLQDSEEAVVAFAALINPYHSPGQNVKLMELVQQVIGEDNARRNKLFKKKGKADGTTETIEGELDDTELQYANMLAYHVPLWTGIAAEHGTTAAGVNSGERLTRRYREKHQSGGRGGGAGNPFTIPLYNQLFANAWEGMVVEQKDASGQKIPLIRLLTQMSRVHKGRGEQGEEDYKNLAETILFKENAELDYFSNQIIRAFKLDAFIRGAKELRLKDYSKWVQDVGRVFDREKFQQDMVKNIISHARYAFKTYGDINYDEVVWGEDPDLKENGGWRLMFQAEKMFGKEILDDKRFWKVENGHKVFINTTANKELLFKRFISGIISGQILDHTKIAPWASNTKYDFGDIDGMIEALRKIPDGAEFGDEMADYKVTDRFFTNEMLRWIQQHAKQGFAKRYLLEFFRTMAFGDSKKKETEVGFSAFSEMLQMFITSIPGQTK